MLVDAKRLLQQYRHEAVDPGCPLNGRFRGESRHGADSLIRSRLTQSRLWILQAIIPKSVIRDLPAAAWPRLSRPCTSLI
jgi:hypothetical protein